MRADCPALKRPSLDFGPDDELGFLQVAGAKCGPARANCEVAGTPNCDPARAGRGGQPNDSAFRPRKKKAEQSAQLFSISLTIMMISMPPRDLARTPCRHPCRAENLVGKIVSQPAKNARRPSCNQRAADLAEDTWCLVQALPTKPCGKVIYWLPSDES
jgi:hypothetical protein